MVNHASANPRHSVWRYESSNGESDAIPALEADSWHQGSAAMERRFKAELKSGEEQ